MRSFLLLAFLFLLLLGQNAQANTLYVNRYATGANDGSSWLNAYTDLQDAINNAAIADEIWVAKGTYHPLQFPTNAPVTDPRNKAFYINKNLKIYGGFAGTETQLTERNHVLNPTVLSGDFNGDDNGIYNNTENAYHVFITANCSTATVIDGFTVKGGSSFGLTASSSISFNGKTFNQNCGGGMYNHTSSPTIVNILFTENATSAGGGMYNSNNASPTLVNVSFVSNIALSKGGGICNVYTSSPKLTNVAFIKNAAFEGGGMYNFLNSASILTNLSFSGNTATKGGAICNASNSDVFVRNTIIWGNAHSEVFNDINSVPEFYSSIIKGSGGSNNWNTNYGTDKGNNLDIDPLFYTNTDVRIVTGSPAADAGNNLYNNILMDVNGNPRFQNGTIDIGATEGIIAVSPKRFFVKYNATGANNGSNWADAFTDLQTAFNTATKWDEVWIAAGTYLPTQFPTAIDTANARNKTFFLQHDLKIYGGFVGNEVYLSERNHAAHPTILSADLNNDDVLTNTGSQLSIANNTENAYHVLIAVGLTPATLIDGITLKGGHADNLAGATLFGLQTFYGYRGGGMYNIYASPTITNVCFIGNSAPKYNSSIYNGGGMYNEYSSPVLTNTLFNNNYAYAGGAIYNNTSHLTLTNVSLVGNLALQGCGIYNYFSDPLVQNTILWNCANSDVFNSTSNPVFSYCIVKGSGGSNAWNANYGTDGGNNLDFDPLFVSATNMSLQPTSPAINTGNNNYNNTLIDLAGNTRIFKATIDIGAYEYEDSPLPVELLYFTGEATETGNLLAWATASEENNKGFEVQKSTDARTFEKIGFVAGNGTTTEQQTYEFLDKSAMNGVVYYRLKQIDFDDAFEYSNIISLVNKGVAPNLLIYPNPVRDVLTIQNAQETTAIIYNALGQPVQQFAVQNALFNVGLNDLPNGVYTLLLQQPNGATTTTQLVKQY